MTKTDLVFYVEPESVGITLQVWTQDEDWLGLDVIIDTGAEVGLLPIHLLEVIDHQNSRVIELQQAGIAGHYFTGILADIVVKISDSLGQHSRQLRIRVVFAETELQLIGFGGFLNEAILYMNMPRLSGYLEIE